MKREKFKAWIKMVKCKLDIHEPLPSNYRFDGVLYFSTCRHCGNRIAKDKQCSWYSIEGQYG